MKTQPECRSAGGINSRPARWSLVLCTWILWLVPILGMGCVSTYEYEEPTLEAGPLAEDRRVMICTPEDGWYSTTRYPNSGDSTARALREAFVPYARLVTIGPQCDDNTRLEDIDTSGYDYVVCPTILHWENRATEWSGLPDRIRIGLVVYNASSRDVLAKGSYAGKSKWATFGGDKPEDLLPEPTQRFVDQLYGKTETGNSH